MTDCTVKMRSGLLVADFLFSRGWRREGPNFVFTYLWVIKFADFEPRNISQKSKLNQYKVDDGTFYDLYIFQQREQNDGTFSKPTKEH